MSGGALGGGRMVEDSSSVAGTALSYLLFFILGLAILLRSYS